MRFSATTLSLIARLWPAFSEPASCLWLSEGCLFACSNQYWNKWRSPVTLLITDDKAGASEGCAVYAEFLSKMILGGAAGAKGGELIAGPDHASMTWGSMTLNANVREKGLLPIGFEGWEKTYRITDPATFLASLKDAMASVGKGPKAKTGTNLLHFDKGEVLATNGHQAVVRYIEIDAQARFDSWFGALFIKLLQAFQKSQGSWYLSTSEGRVSLAFRHFGQEIRLSVPQDSSDHALTADRIRKVVAMHQGAENGLYLTADTADFCKLFDLIAVYSNGEVLGYMVDDPHNNNGQSGLIPRDEKPLVVLDTNLLKAALPKATKKTASKVWVGFDAPMGDDAEQKYGSMTVQDAIVMSRRVKLLPTLPDDAYTAEQRAEQAA